VIPDTRYARLDDAFIAFQVVGSGARDIVFMSAWFSHVDGRWEEPHFAGMLRRLAGLGRLIVFDKRGSGASDPLPSDQPTWEDWSDDILAVMDAAGSDRATIIGVGDSGPMSLLFAAHHPERVSSLVIANSGARLMRGGDDYPWGATPEELEKFLARAQRTWGTGGISDVFAPSVADDEKYRQWWARYQRMGASPGRSVRMAKLIFQMDARDALSKIHVPTLILHRKGFRFFPVELSRYLAENIAGAKLVELEGADGFIYLGDMNGLIDEVEEFVTGVRRAPDVDRALATVLITDMIGSTDLAAKLGDRRWREILDKHDEVIRDRLQAHRGRLHRATGDGILATFDGPGRAIHCAFEIRDALRGVGVEIRTGIHTGEIEFRGNEIGGIAVHIAARLMTEAGAGEVIASETVKALATGSGITFQDRGTKALKGVPDEWRLYALN
jgi:pimeloyl-ACP methyl ester carboxylesterase/class 3 adenylate cyclase